MNLNNSATISYTDLPRSSIILFRGAYPSLHFNYKKEERHAHYEQHDLFTGQVSAAWRNTSKTRICWGSHRTGCFPFSCALSGLGHEGRRARGRQCEAGTAKEEKNEVCWLYIKSWDEIEFSLETAECSPNKARTNRSFSPEDQATLEAEYKKNPKPDKAARLAIVNQVCLGEKEVQVSWTAKHPRTFCIRAS